MSETVLENRYADELRQARRGKEDSYSSSVPEQDGEPSSLRERVMQARNALNVKEKARQALENKVTAPVNQATSRLLKQSWLNLISSFGLTLIYINIHVFLKAVLGEKLFCKLGREWAPAQVRATGGEAVEKFSAKIGLIEVMALLLLDLAVLFAVFMSLAYIYLLIDIYLHPLEAVWTYGIGTIWEAIKVLF